MANKTINGEDHDYQLELARALGAFERRVALAGAAPTEEPYDEELRDIVDRVTRLAYTDGFEKGWKASRKIKRLN